MQRVFMYFTDKLASNLNADTNYAAWSVDERTDTTPW
jgi:hypothetical protein